MRKGKVQPRTPPGAPVGERGGLTTSSKLRPRPEAAGRGVFSELHWIGREAGDDAGLVGGSPER